MFLLMLPFGAFKFLWANAIVIKCVGEVQEKVAYICHGVKVCSNIFLVHVMGILNKISEEPLLSFIDSKHFRSHKITNAMLCVESQCRYLPL